MSKKILKILGARKDLKRDVWVINFHQTMEVSTELIADDPIGSGEMILDMMKTNFMVEIKAKEKAIYNLKKNS